MQRLAARLGLILDNVNAYPPHTPTQTITGSGSAGGSGRRRHSTGSGTQWSGSGCFTTPPSTRRPAHPV